MIVFILDFSYSNASLFRKKEPAMAEKVRIFPGNKEFYIRMLRKREAEAKAGLKKIQDEISAYLKPLAKKTE